MNHVRIYVLSITEQARILKMIHLIIEQFPLQWDPSFEIVRHFWLNLKSSKSSPKHNLPVSLCRVFELLSQSAKPMGMNQPRMQVQCTREHSNQLCKAQKCEWAKRLRMQARRMNPAGSKLLSTSAGLVNYNRYTASIEKRSIVELKRKGKYEECLYRCRMTSRLMAPEPNPNLPVRMLVLSLTKNVLRKPRVEIVISRDRRWC